MKKFNVTLNINYYLSKKNWQRIYNLCKEMPYWKGNSEKLMLWYDYDSKIIKAGEDFKEGLKFYAELPEQEWFSWITLFKKKASAIVGYEVGEIENGYDFNYFDDLILEDYYQHKHIKYFNDTFIQIFNINLNIHYSAPAEIWKKLDYLSKKMPEFNHNAYWKMSWYGYEGK